MFEEPILTKKDTPLEDLSVDELKYRVTELQGQIAACEALIKAKEAHKNAADSLFGGGD